MAKIDLDLGDTVTGLPDGSYFAVVTKCYVATEKSGFKRHAESNKISPAGEARWLKFSYKLEDNESASVNGETVRERQSFDPDDDEVTKKWFKKRLEGLGLTEDEISDFDTDTPVGKKVIVTVQTKNQTEDRPEGYQQVTGVRVRPESA